MNLCKLFGHKYESLGDLRVVGGSTAKARRCVRCQKVQTWVVFTLEPRTIQRDGVTIQMLGRDFADWIDADEVSAKV